MHTIERSNNIRAAYWAYLKAMSSTEPDGGSACWRALELYRNALRSQRAGAQLARVSPSRRANLKDVRRRWKRLERRQAAPGVVVVPFDRLPGTERLAARSSTLTVAGRRKAPARGRPTAEKTPTGGVLLPFDPRASDDKDRPRRAG